MWVNSRRRFTVHDKIASRKASKDYHPSKSGVLVKDSGDEIPVSTTTGGLSLNVNFSGPPQINPDYAMLLAFRQIQGFFSLVTSSNPTAAPGTSLLSAEYFRLFGTYGHGDWGNPQLVEIAARASKIPCFANIVTANGFFKVIVRRSKEDTGEWFWALQWNKTYRVVGSIGMPNQESSVFQDLPPLSWTNLGIQGGAATRIRPEMPLQVDDLLFEGDVAPPEEP